MSQDDDVLARVEETLDVLRDLLLWLERQYRGKPCPECGRGLASAHASGCTLDAILKRMAATASPWKTLHNQLKKEQSRDN